MGKKKILPQNINSRISDLLKKLTDEEGGNNQEIVELLLDIQKQNTQLSNYKLPTGEIVSAYRDVTKRKQTEQKIELSEMNLKSLINNRKEAIWSIDNEYNYIIFNDFFKGLYYKTYKIKLEVGINALDLLTGELYDFWKEKYDRALSGEKYSFEFKAKIGKNIHYYEVSLNPIISQKKITGVSALSIDITERKRTVEALVESEGNYKGIFNTSSNAIYIQDKNGVFIDVNVGAEEMYGYKRSSFIGKTPEFISAPGKNDLNAVVKAVKKAYNGEEQKFEYWGLKKNGEVFPKDVKLYPGKYNGEKVVIAVAQDISERKEAEKALRESEEKYRVILNSTSDYIFSTTIDENGNNRPTWVGGSFEKITGYTFEEYKKNGGWCAALHPDDVARDREAFKQLNKNENVKLEVRTFNKSGEIVWVETSASPVWDKKNNKLFGINGACTDITKEKLASIALRKSEEKYKLLSLVTSDYVFETEISEDGASELIWVGGSFEEITGYRFEEYKKIGGWRAVIHPDDIKIDDDAFKENLANETVSIEVRTYHKNGNIIWVRAFGYPHWDYSNNKLSGILGSVKDITKEKEALLALQEREEKYKLISDITSDYLFESRFNKKNILKTIWVAGSFKEMTGYTLEEYQKVGGWSKLLFREDIAIDAEALEELKQNRKTVVELRTHHKDGRTIWVKNSCSPIWDKENNKLLGVIGAVKDITEEKQNQIIHEIQYNIANAIVNATNTKELFSKVREELNKILNTTNFLIAFYDEKTGMFLPDIDKDEKDDIETWSAEKSISGLLIEKKKRLIIKKEEILELASSGKIDIIGTVPEVWLGVSLKVRNKVIGIMAVQHYTNRNAYDKKSIDLFEVVGNQLSLYLERNRAKEDALRLSRAIVQSPVSIAITNLEGEIEYVNPKFEKVSGYTFEEVIGETTNILKSDTMSKEFYENLWNTILEGNDWRGEFLNKRKDGGLYWENAVISPIENDSGQITHFVAIKEDITEKKKMIEELIASKEKAEVSEKIKTEFLAQMSHEIRSPLNVILSFVGLLKEDLADIATDEMMQSFESIDSASTRITRTIDLILNMTDLQLGSYESTIEEIDVIETLDRIKSEYNHSAIIKGLDLRESIQFDRKKINSDKYALVQIISNLVDNAIKYSDSGFIEIFADNNEKKDLVIKVKDTGIGISKEFLPEIFNSFSQEEQGYTRSYDGNGLGMALVKKYCDIISADISVKSKKGKGTTFTLIIPSLKMKQ